MSCCIFEGEARCFNWIFDFRLTAFFFFFLSTRTVCTCLSANNIKVNIEPETLIFHWSSQVEKAESEHV